MIVSSRACLVALLILGAASLPAEAQQWPGRPVKIVVPFSAGGTGDLLARTVAEKLSATFGQSFVVEDRPGAGGLIGAEAGMRATPDGYNLFVSSFGSLVVSPAFNPVAFDPIKDFTHIAYLGGQAAVLIANKDLPVRDLAGLIAYAKARPGTVNYATISVGSQTQLLAELFKKQAGISMTHVPYRGAAQIVTDVVGGHLPLGSIALSATAGQLKGGAVRGLALSADQRLAEFPELPTYKEQGFPDLVSGTWFALAGPANLPPDIVGRLNAAVVKAVQSSDVQARFDREGIDSKTLDSPAFTAFFKSEIDRWLPLAKAVFADSKAAAQ
jgi:tripartite-type tricarboxylate transporter receptor subunit TctC